MIARYRCFGKASPWVPTRKPGDKMKLVIERDGKQMDIEATLGQRKMDVVSNDGTQKPSVAQTHLVWGPTFSISLENAGIAQVAKAISDKSGKDVMDLFARLWESGITIVLITHEPQVAAYGDRLLALRDGRFSVALRHNAPASLLLT